jgi:hypothetical protein
MQLKNPLKDGLVLLRGERTFIMRLKEEEPKIGKMKKGFKIITKASNLRTHLKGGHVGKQANTQHLYDIYAGKLLKRSSTNSSPSPSWKQEGFCIVEQVVNFAMNTNHMY